MITLSKITDPDMMLEARDWVTDALMIHGHAYQEADVIKIVERWHEGGVQGFLQCAAPVYIQR